ncbi:uncharacterized protein EpC_pEp0260060 (plasmid) [Erwinia pyrifoliae Ep1/96]|nr:uncharacterized protein EpC_pEp0260060 [Erwinia pyrifoliae Ep1/96]
MPAPPETHSEPFEAVSRKKPCLPGENSSETPSGAFACMHGYAAECLTDVFIPNLTRNRNKCA